MHRSDPSLHWILLSIAVAVLAVAVLLQLDTAGQVVEPLFGCPLPESCVFRRATGVPCPGCGLTRSFICLVRGDVLRAWTFNPAGLLLFPVVAVQVPYRVLQLWRIRRNQEEYHPTTLGLIVCCALCAALIGQWVVRLVV